MNNYPEYVEVNNRKYKINTSYKNAIECNRIAEDSTIGDTERALAIVYVLFGEEALNNFEDISELLELAVIYLNCGKKPTKKETKKDMDYIEDMSYIKASFMSDYHIDLNNTDMHFWEFYELINGLSNSDMGNCCVLNRVRNLRNYDLKTIKDPKERKKVADAQKEVELKCNKKAKILTKEQRQSAKQFYEELYRKE